MLATLIANVFNRFSSVSWAERETCGAACMNYERPSCRVAKLRSRLELSPTELLGLASKALAGGPDDAPDGFFMSYSAVKRPRKLVRNFGSESLLTSRFCVIVCSCELR